MNYQTRIAGCFLLGVCWSSVVSTAHAQDAGTARALAPYDFTGYWISVVTEDWRWRMMTAPKGDTASVPLNAAGQAAANAWDPDGESDACKPYGAAGVMRMPLRIHIAWEDDSTLRLDTDHGMQRRIFHFAADAGATAAAPSLQGYSTAQWAGNPGGQFEFVNVTPQLSYLKVVTTNLAPGYLRRNGVPYSDKAVLTEYFERHTDFGEEWITVTSIVNDPTYLTQEFITSSSFKKLDGDASWNPVPCR
jgi:hypothetical protein